MPQIAETCGCGATLALTSQYWSDMHIAQQKFQAAHAPCRAKPKAQEIEPFVQLELGAWSQRVRDAVFYARVICRSKGYALAVHGTMRRDVDVVATPWTADACDAQVLANALRDGLIEFGVGLDWDHKRGVPEQKPFGRLGYAIVLQGEPFMYLDISVAPRAVGDEKRLDWCFDHGLRISANPTGVHALDYQPIDRAELDDLISRCSDPEARPKLAAARQQNGNGNEKGAEVTAPGVG